MCTRNGVHNEIRQLWSFLSFHHYIGCGHQTQTMRLSSLGCQCLCPLSHLADWWQRVRREREKSTCCRSPGFVRLEVGCSAVWEEQQQALASPQAGSDGSDPTNYRHDTRPLVQGWRLPGASIASALTPLWWSLTLGIANVERFSLDSTYVWYSLYFTGDAISTRFKITQVSFTTQNCIHPSKVSSLNPHTPNLASRWKDWAYGCHSTNLPIFVSFLLMMEPQKPSLATGFCSHPARASSKAYA